MRCPYCSSLKTQVVDKRESGNNSEITRRRRECLKCKKRFTTYERLESTNLIVIKKDKRREPFNHEKLKNGLIRACEKRPISSNKIEEITDKIENKLRDKKTKEISSKLIGKLVMDELKKLDKVAYIRFASVYQEFHDPKDFEKEVKKLIKK
ncbi:MAG: transcriptional regulator NrdR [Candidatus Woesearchaeota archaeon]